MKSIFLQIEKCGDYTKKPRRSPSFWGRKLLGIRVGENVLQLTRNIVVGKGRFAAGNCCRLRVRRARGVGASVFVSSFSVFLCVFFICCFAAAAAAPATVCYQRAEFRTDASSVVSCAFSNFILAPRRPSVKCSEKQQSCSPS